MSEQLTAKERDVMEHACAWRSSASPLARNYYCADPDTDVWPTLQALCARGLMRRREQDGGSFYVTFEGLLVLAGVTREYVEIHRFDLLRPIVANYRKQRRGLKPAGGAS